MFKLSKQGDKKEVGRTLYLLRHAEAENSSPDQDRKLTPAGKATARKVGLQMRERKYKPERVLCSTARRTKETLGELGLFSKFEYVDEIYNATPEELLAVLRQQGGKAESLLLVGHNPGIHTLAAALTGQGEKRLVENVNASFPPASLAVLTFSGEWKDLAARCATLSSLILS